MIYIANINTQFDNCILTLFMMFATTFIFFFFHFFFFFFSYTIFIYLFIYLFIYGCVGSSFLREGFL